MAWNDNPSGRSGWGDQSRQPRNSGSWGQPPQWGQPPRPKNTWGQPPQWWGQPGPPSYVTESPRLPNLELPLGTKCRIKTAKGDQIVTIIKVGREQYEVRMPDLTINWFYPHELEVVQDQE